MNRGPGSETRLLLIDNKPSVVQVRVWHLTRDKSLSEPMMTQFTSAGTRHHYGDVIMGTMASQITSLTIVYSTVYSGADQRKHQSSASLVFARGIHRGPVNSSHKWLVTRKMFPFDDVIVTMLFVPVSTEMKPRRYPSWVDLPALGRSAFFVVFVNWCPLMRSVVVSAHIFL